MERPWLKNYEPLVPANLNYLQRPLHANLEESARKYPTAVATIFMDARLTYAQLSALVDRFAATLQELGVAKGDRVAVYVANCPQFIVGYYGALKVGAIVVPFNPLYAAREVEHQLKDSGAETMLAMSRFYPIVKDVRARTPLKNLVLTNIKEYFPPVVRLLFTLVREKQEGDR
jgi:long-chain acyl-CoA synthetase